MPPACARSVSRGAYLDAFRAWLISAIDNLSRDILEPRARMLRAIHNRAQIALYKGDAE